MEVKVLGFELDEQLERTELQFYKYILHLPGNASNAAVQGELGQFPIHMFWKERIFKYWCRLSSGNVPIYLQPGPPIHCSETLMLENSVGY